MNKVSQLLEVWRFGIVGIVATLTHLGIAAAASYLWHQQALAANAAGYVVALVVSYFGHFYFTFRHTSGHQRYWWRFLFMSLSGYLVSNIAVLVVTGLGYVPVWGFTAAALIVPVYSFIVAKLWAFAAPAEH